MNTLFTDPAFKLYALTAAILALHLFFLAGGTGAARTRAKAFVNPEDATLNKAEQVETDHPNVLRWKRAHQNAIESALPFFVVGFLYSLTGPSFTGAQAYFYTFLGARILHSIFYLAGKQPFRTISFAVGALAVAGMAIRVLRMALL
jgi:uncharacterized MAPEG superfamily protein